MIFGLFAKAEPPPDIAAQISGAVAAFRNDVTGYIGETATRWLFFVIFFVFVVLPAINIVSWFLGDKVEKWMVVLRERKEQAETEREEQQSQGEWNAFTNWVKQNPVTAERLMRTVEFEQIKDPDRAARNRRTIALGSDPVIRLA